MSIVVPYDDSELSRLALDRASHLASLAAAEIHAVTVIPEDGPMVREYGWLDEGESFDADLVEDRLRERVTEHAPEATFHPLSTGSRLPGGAIGKRLRQKAQDLEAALVVIGSENAGKIVTPVSSVGGTVATDEHYDVHLVRTESSLFAEARA